jgi:hypothetical protein
MRKIIKKDSRELQKGNEESIEFTKEEKKDIILK